MLTTDTKTDRTAAALEAELRSLGYSPGYPARYTPMAKAVDAAAARKLRCPACRKRGFHLKPFHKGVAVRCVAVCNACNHAEEV